MTFAMCEISAKISSGAAALLLLLIHDVGTARLDDPEPEITWTPPTDKSMYDYYKVGANYSGLLYAGTVEFNWIVDIRIQDRGQAVWATGNLVSFLHVLTTCTAVGYLTKESTDLKDAHRVKQFPQWIEDVYRSSITLIRISYCENYLWADGNFEFSDTDKRTTGSRSVKKIIRHPDCKVDTLENDAAVLVMNRPIPALEPRIGYMPTGFDYVNEKVKEMVVLNPDQPLTYASPLCYVAAFGRNYKNHVEFYVIDYKVKFRVYINKWKECADVWDYVCSEDDGDRRCADHSIRESGKDHLMCLRPRARVGTVCDRDRGAPVVCNGQVIGLVIRGAKEDYCNNLYKIPFIAEKLDHYKEFFDDSVKYIIQPVPRKEGTPTPAPGDAKGTVPAPLSSISALNALKIFHISFYYFQVREIMIIPFLLNVQSFPL